VTLFLKGERTANVRLGIGISQWNGRNGEFEMWGVTAITAPPSGGCAHDPAESRMLAQGRAGIQRYAAILAAFGGVMRDCQFF